MFSRPWRNTPDIQISSFGNVSTRRTRFLPLASANVACVEWIDLDRVWLLADIS